MVKIVPSTQSYCELMRDIAARSGYSLSATQDIVTALLEQMKVELRKNRKIVLPQFGTFFVGLTPNRRANNLALGKVVHDRPRRKVKFRPAESFDQEFKPARKGRIIDETGKETG